MKTYAVYKGDEFLFVGTVEECAKHLNVKKETVLFMTYPSYQKRVKEDSDRLEVIKVESGESE